MFGRRGEPLDEVIERFTRSSGRRGASRALSRAHSAVDSFAYKAAPDGQGPAGRAVTACSAGKRLRTRSERWPGPPAPATALAYGCAPALDGGCSMRSTHTEELAGE
jgi:hypothetical protein